MRKCLYCYKSLEEDQADFHPACSRKIFGTSEAPILPYTKDEIDSLALQVVRSQVTLTGVQPKLSLDFAEKRSEPKRFTIVGLWGQYILKPQTERHPFLPENEDLTMHLAQIAKIKTVPHSLIRFADGSLAYITKRIDRDKRGNKLPMEDMCQLTERLTEYKYKGSYEQIARKIVEFSANPVFDLINFCEVLLFCYLTGNSDMHLKNFSLYKNKGAYGLTPAYDLLSTLLVIPEDKEELALTLNGRKNRLKRSDFDHLLDTFDIELKVRDNIYAKFRKVIPQWLDFIDHSFLPQNLKDSYKELINTKKTIILQ